MSCFENIREYQQIELFDLESVNKGHVLFLCRRASSDIFLTQTLYHVSFTYIHVSWTRLQRRSCGNLCMSRCALSNCWVNVPTCVWVPNRVCCIFVESKVLFIHLRVTDHNTDMWWMVIVNEPDNYCCNKIAAKQTVWLYFKSRCYDTFSWIFTFFSNLCVIKTVLKYYLKEVRGHPESRYCTEYFLLEPVMDDNDTCKCDPCLKYWWHLEKS